MKRGGKGEKKQSRFGRVIVLGEGAPCRKRRGKKGKGDTRGENDLYVHRGKGGKKEILTSSGVRLKVGFSCWAFGGEKKKKEKGEPIIIIGTCREARQRE